MVGGKPSVPFGETRNELTEGSTCSSASRSHRHARGHQRCPCKADRYSHAGGTTTFAVLNSRAKSLWLRVGNRGTRQRLLKELLAKQCAYAALPHSTSPSPWLSSSTSSSSKTKSGSSSSISARFGAIHCTPKGPGRPAQACPQFSRSAPRPSCKSHHSDDELQTRRHIDTGTGFCKRTVTNFTSDPDMTVVRSLLLKHDGLGPSDSSLPKSARPGLRVLRLISLGSRTLLARGAFTGDPPLSLKLAPPPLAQLYSAAAASWNGPTRLH